MKKLISIFLVLAAVGSCFISTASAGEIDILLDVLVEQGVLTPIKAEIVRDETKKRVAEEIAQGKHPNLPKWIQTMKLGGDLRLRYQYSDKRHDSSQGDHLGRFRLRLGADAKVNDKVKVAFGIATEGDDGDHDSRNITFGQSFEGKSIRPSQAYGLYLA